MPIPFPNKKEKRSEFLSRCMGDKVMNDEFNNISQRYAICFKKWEDKKKAASAIIESKDDEVAYFMEDNN
jgi:hypothetical protein